MFDDQNKNVECVGPTSSTAGTASSCDGCPNQKLCKDQEFSKDTTVDDVQNALKHIKCILVVLSGKGGVGKSTVAFRIANYLSSSNQSSLKTTILDIDLCGPSMPTLLNVEDEEINNTNLGWEPIAVSDKLGLISAGSMLPDKDTPLIYRGPKKTALLKSMLVNSDFSDTQILVIDTPPGTSDEHISLMQFLKKLDNYYGLIVTTPSKLSIADVRKELNFCIKTNLRLIGIVSNMHQFKTDDDIKQEMFEDSNLLDKMATDFNTKIICKLDWDRGIKQELKENYDDQNIQLIYERVQKVFK